MQNENGMRDKGNRGRMCVTVGKEVEGWVMICLARGSQDEALECDFVVGGGPTSDFAKGE